MISSTRTGAALWRRPAVRILEEHITQALLRIATEIEVEIIQSEAEPSARPRTPKPALEGHSPISHLVTVLTASDPRRTFAPRVPSQRLTLV